MARIGIDALNTALALGTSLVEISAYYRAVLPEKLRRIIIWNFLNG